MAPEIINLFIQKQKNLIGELQSKLLLAETQTEITQANYSALQEENKNLLQQIEKLESKKAKAQQSE